MEGRTRSTNPSFRLFAYGTLKRGFSNHDRFCAGALAVEEAAVRGDLYDLPFGFPALVVPEKSIRAVGTTDYAFDAGRHGVFGNGLGALTEGPRVYGEVFTFDDPGERLPELDRLEGFDPEGTSLYRRVLIPVETAAGVALAWAYAIEKPSGRHLPEGFWPS